ncbi:heat shock protein 23-like [Contarinia nasturtii]|uniref:heat shock protein 23-like n=1 Tax=Contarinia nasturtii TaxID=265458 RepID=UPI0012D43D50|nr:heat shock protein 23-like [Contarinia nasturtii]
MSLLPYLIDEMLPTSYHQPSLRTANFWTSPIECKLFGSLNPTSYVRSTLSNFNDLEKQAKLGKDCFQACLDVAHFQPNEISVKTIDNTIVIEASHEEREDSHGYISRRFTRRYDLPEDFKAKDVISSISSDGILTIKCPKSEPAVEGNVRHVQIQQTGPARLNVVNKDDKKITKDQKK